MNHSDPNEVSLEGERPDQALLDAYRAGSETAAEELFHRYYGRLIQLVRRERGLRLAALDASSDVALSVMRSFFDHGMSPSFEVDEANGLWPFLFTIALNKIRGRALYWRRQRRDVNKAVPLGGADDALVVGPTPQDLAAMNEIIELLLSRFTDRRQQILRMVLDGYKQTEIADAMNTSERTVYATRKAAEAALKKLLDVDSRADQ